MATGLVPEVCEVATPVTGIPTSCVSHDIVDIVAMVTMFVVILVVKEVTMSTDES